MFFTYLKQNNIFCEELQLAGSCVRSSQEQPSAKMISHTDLTANFNSNSQFFEVGCFSADNILRNRRFVYKLKGNFKYLDMSNPLVETLSYPLLFAHGELGWDRNQKNNCSFLNYLRIRLLMPEPGWSLPLRTPITSKEGKIIRSVPANRYN